MITPNPPPVFSLTLLGAQAVLSARLGPGTAGRLPLKTPEVMVDDIAVEGQNISTDNFISLDIVIAGLRKWGRGSVSQNGNPDERRPVTHLSKEIRDH